MMTLLLWEARPNLDIISPGLALVAGHSRLTSTVARIWPRVPLLTHGNVRLALGRYGLRSGVYPTAE